MVRALACATLIAAIMGSSSIAAAQAAGPRPPLAPGEMPQPPKLTKSDVERLLVVIPELAKQGAALQARPPAPGEEPDAQQLQEDMKKVEALLSKHGFTIPEFFLGMSALVSTFMALEPTELDKRLPTENTPEVRAILDDPNVSDADKKALRDQIAQAQSNKDAIRAQLTALATEENKRVVKPMLAQVKRVLELAEVESKKARDQMLQEMQRQKAKGPRRGPSAPPK